MQHAETLDRNCGPVGFVVFVLCDDVLWQRKMDALSDADAVWESIAEASFQLDYAKDQRDPRWPLTGRIPKRSDYGRNRYGC